MSPQTRSQTAQSSSATPRSTRAPLKLSSEESTWRCDRNGRLHRESGQCTDTPPTSPIIDTPAKRARLMRQRNALLPHSQAAQPTPSAAPRQRPQMEADQTEEGEEQEEEESLVPANVREVDDAHENDQESQQLPSHLSRTPSPATSERIPETPLGLGLNIPSSPPLPALTAANLSLLDQQTATNHHATSNDADIPASAAPVDTASRYKRLRTPASIYSVATSVRDQISHLVLRTHINGEQHAAADRAHCREATRRRAWRDALIALLGLCLAYFCWCYYNSADFEFIAATRRDWYGL